MAKEKMFGHCRVDGICRSFDPEKVDYVLKAREIYLEKNEKLWENFEKMDKSEFEVDGLGMDKKMVAEFLGEEKNAEMFTKMFIYLSQLMDIPICLTMSTVESIAGLNGQQEMAEEYLLSRVKEGARQSRALRRCEGAKSTLGPIAFLFDGTGITEIAVREDGFKCAETLLNPPNVAKFMEKIILALKTREKVKIGEFILEINNFKGEEDSFNETVNSVVKTLKNGIEGEKTEIDNWIEKLDEKWGKIKIKMKIKKIGKEFKVKRRKLKVEIWN